jgi:hypothetical protein
MVAVYSQANDYARNPIFLAWISDAFLPEVVRRRPAFGYEEKTVLIMDNCTPRTGPEVDKLWEAYGIVVCPLLSKLESGSAPRSLKIRNYQAVDRPYQPQGDHERSVGSYFPGRQCLHVGLIPTERRPDVWKRRDHAVAGVG